MTELNICRVLDTESNVCYICDKSYVHSNTLTTHLRKKHSLPLAMKKRFKCALCSCQESSKKFWIEHMKQEHNISVKSEEFHFSSVTEFEKWKKETERITLSKFVKHSGTLSAVTDIKTIYYHCNRSGYFVPRAKTSRRPKKQGTIKIGGLCPAKMKVDIRIQDGQCCVEYVSTHAGHDFDVSRPDIKLSGNDTILAANKNEKIEKKSYLEKNDMSQTQKCDSSEKPIPTPNEIKSLKEPVHSPGLMKTDNDSEKFLLLPGQTETKSNFDKSVSLPLQTITNSSFEKSVPLPFQTDPNCTFEKSDSQPEQTQSNKTENTMPLSDQKLNVIAEFSDIVCEMTSSELEIVKKIVSTLKNTICRARLQQNKLQSLSEVNQPQKRQKPPLQKCEPTKKTKLDDNTHPAVTDARETQLTIPVSFQERKYGHSTNLGKDAASASTVVNTSNMIVPSISNSLMLQPIQNGTASPACKTVSTVSGAEETPRVKWFLLQLKETDDPASSVSKTITTVAVKANGESLPRASILVPNSSDGSNSSPSGTNSSTKPNEGVESNHV